MKRLLNVYDDLTEYWKSHQKQLELNYPGINFDILLNYFLDYFKIDAAPEFLKTLYAHANYNDFKQALKTGTPASYFFNNRYFYNANFFVNKDVLIPRFESELLVEEALKLLPILPVNDTLNVLEVGVGSGNILLTFLMELNTKLKVNALAIDNSESALAVFKINAFLKKSRLNPEFNLSFLHSDRLAAVSASARFHLIISNPPYIPSDKVEGVHAQVLKCEPFNALFIDRDKYSEWFLTFFKQIEAHLNGHGHFIMEGHEDELVGLKPLLIKAKLTFVSIIKDYNNLDRILIAKKDDV